MPRAKETKILGLDPRVPPTGNTATPTDPSKLTGLRVLGQTIYYMVKSSQGERAAARVANRNPQMAVRDFLESRPFLSFIGLLMYGIASHLMAVESYNILFQRPDFDQRILAGAAVVTIVCLALLKNAGAASGCAAPGLWAAYCSDMDIKKLP